MSLLPSLLLILGITVFDLAVWSFPVHFHSTDSSSHAALAVQFDSRSQNMLEKVVLARSDF